MKTKLIQKIKEDFEVRFRHYDVWQENGETKGVTVNDIFSDELWNFIESAISQSKEELVEEIEKWLNENKYPERNGTSLNNVCYEDLIRLLEDLNKK